MMGMKAKLRFLGAAQNVTGSAYLLEANGSRLLVDCGLYQERDLVQRNWGPFPVSPEATDAVLLTHAHLDHCGLLPKLVRDGFRGRIFCTFATAEIARIILSDAARLQEEDAESKRRRHEWEGRKGPYPEVPLYRTADAEACFSRFSPVDYGRQVKVGNGVKATFRDAGHVLGSSMIEVEIGDVGNQKTVLFSGDVGRWNRPILRDPTVFDKADYVVVESTYGDRIHDDPSDAPEVLADVINSTVEAGGNVVIPSFALERSQEILYWLSALLTSGRIPHLAVFLDSPMAASVTEVFQHHVDLLDEETKSLIRGRRSPFDLPGLKTTRTVDESKAIDRIKGTVVVIAGSGMCNGGRVKHHLVTNISRTDSTILFVGYQAEGTLGRKIVDGFRRVRILGQEYAVSARVVQMGGLSAHGDRDELFRWLSGLRTPPWHVFVTHGEPKASNSFARFVNEQTGWATSAPRYLEEATLD